MQNRKNILCGLILFLGMALLTSSCGSSRLLNKKATGARDMQNATPDQLFMKGQQMKLKRQHEKAIYFFKAFQKLKPENATASYEIARQYNLLKKPDSTLFYAKQAAHLDTANKWILQFYARTLAQHKRFDSAARIFHRLALKHPHSGQFTYQEALMLASSKKYNEALPLFNLLEKQQGINEELVYQKQRIYLKLHQIDSAADEIQKLIARDPENGRYYALLAKVYANHEQPSEAIKVYQKLLYKQPGNPHAELALGILYKQIDSTLQFKNYIRKAFRNPQFNIENKIRFIYPFLKYVEIDPEEQPDALWLCRLLTQIHRQDARAHALYGDMYFQCKEPDSALSQYKKALNYNSNRYEIWNQILFIYIQKGNVDSLFYYSRKAVNQFPDNAKARYFNGMALLFKGHNKDAASELLQALRIGVSNRELKRQIYHSLNTIYLKLNNRKAAAKYKKLAENLKKNSRKNRTHSGTRNQPFL